MNQPLNVQWNVRTFMNQYVIIQYKRKFFEFMKKWDGSIGNSVLYSFYNFDLLMMKLQEVKEYYG